MTKKKILLWGFGLSYANRREIFNHALFRDKYNIMAVISAHPSLCFEENIRIISKDDIHHVEYDEIVICALPENEASIRRDAAKVGIDSVKLILYEQFIDREPKLLESVKEQRTQEQLKVIENILQADEKKLGNYAWWREQICQYGVYCFEPQWYEKIGVTWSVNGIMQLPGEFASFCLMLSSLPPILSAMELGVHRGRSSYFMAAVLQQKCPNLVYNMVDVCDKLDDFDKFHGLLPSLHKRIPSTSENYSGQHYDFVFIDADHSYDASIEDYRNVGQYANIMVGFHDIYAHEYDCLNGGTVRMWQEVTKATQGKTHNIFSAYPGKWMGIGTILMN